jgi:hypothetical protein
VGAAGGTQPADLALRSLHAGINQPRAALEHCLRGAGSSPAPVLEDNPAGSLQVERDFLETIH